MSPEEALALLEEERKQLLLERRLLWAWADDAFVALIAARGWAGKTGAPQELLVLLQKGIGYSMRLCPRGRGS